MALTQGAPPADPEGRWRARSLWLDTLGEPIEPRPPLEADTDCDVAIAGAGFIGLWTAYSLVRADPSLRVVVLEAEIAATAHPGATPGSCPPASPARRACTPRAAPTASSAPSAR